MLVSVIIPCFNVDKYIDECVESVIKQTYLKKEIICIDNNSLDNTWEKLLRLKEKFPEIIIDKEMKAGAPAARNKGLSLAKGEWIQFLDADDLLLSTKIERQVKLIKENNDVCFVVGAYIRRSVDSIDQEIMLSVGNPFLKLLNTQLGNTCSNMFNKAEIEKIGYWNEDYTSSQEAHLMFELLKVNDRVIFDHKINTVIREREEGQISQSNPTRKWQVYTQLRVEMLRYLQKSLPELYEKEKDKILNGFFDTLRIYVKYDRREATKYFHEFFPKEFIPIVSETTTLKYVFLYKLFGFSRTEYLISKINEIRKK